MNSKFIIIIVLFTMLGSYGSYCFKKAASQPILLKIIASPLLYIGGIFYLVSMVVNIYTLKYVPYNIVFPLTSITYIWSLILSKIYLHEKITTKKVIGIVLLCIGAVFIVI